MSAAAKTTRVGIELVAINAGAAVAELQKYGKSLTDLNAIGKTTTTGLNQSYAQMSQGASKLKTAETAFKSLDTAMATTAANAKKFGGSFQTLEQAINPINKFKGSFQTLDAVFNTTATKAQQANRKIITSINEIGTSNATAKVKTQFQTLETIFVNASTKAQQATTKIGGALNQLSAGNAKVTQTNSILTNHGRILDMTGIKYDQLSRKMDSARASNQRLDAELQNAANVHNKNIQSIEATSAAVDKQGSSFQSTAQNLTPYISRMMNFGLTLTMASQAMDEANGMQQALAQSQEKVALLADRAKEALERYGEGSRQAESATKKLEDAQNGLTYMQRNANFAMRDVTYFMVLMGTSIMGTLLPALTNWKQTQETVVGGLGKLKNAIMGVNSATTGGSLAKSFSDLPIINTEIDKTAKNIKKVEQAAASAAPVISGTLPKGFKTVGDEAENAAKKAVGALDNVYITLDKNTKAVNTSKNAMGNLTKEVIKHESSMKGAATATTAASAATGVLGTSVSRATVAMGAIGVVLAAIGTAVALYATNVGGARDAMNEFGANVGNAVPILKPFGEALVGIAGTLGLTGETAEQTKQHFTNMSQGFGEMSTLWNNTVASMQQSNNALIRDVGFMAAGVGTELGEMATKFTGQIQATQSAWDNFMAALAKKDYKEAVDILQESFSAIPGIVTEIATSVYGLFEEIGKGIYAFLDDILPEANEVFDALYGILSEIGSRILAEFNKIGEAIGGTFKEIGSRIGSYLGNVANQVTTWANTNIIQPIMAIPDNIKLGAEAIWNAIIGTGGNILTTVQTWVINNIVSPIMNLTQYLQSVVDSVIQILFSGDFVSSIATWLNKVGIEIMKIPSYVVGQGSKVVDALLDTNYIGIIKNWVGGVWDQLNTAWHNLVTGGAGGDTAQNTDLTDKLGSPKPSTSTSTSNKPKTSQPISTTTGQISGTPTTPSQSLNITDYPDFGSFMQAQYKLQQEETRQQAEQPKIEKNILAELSAKQTKKGGYGTGGGVAPVNVMQPSTQDYTQFQNAFGTGNVSPTNQPIATKPITTSTIQRGSVTSPYAVGGAGAGETSSYEQNFGTSNAVQRQNTQADWDRINKITRETVGREYNRKNFGADIVGSQDINPYREAMAASDTEATAGGLGIAESIEEYKKLDDELGKIQASTTAYNQLLGNTYGQEIIAATGTAKRRNETTMANVTLKESQAYNKEYTAQLKEGSILTTAWNQGIEDQIKKENDRRVALEASHGATQKRQEQMKTGMPLELAFAEGMDKQKNALMDQQEALRFGQGELKVFNEQMATGVPQALAFGQGQLEMANSMNQANLNVSKTRGAILEYGNELKAGIPQAIAYNQSLEDQRLAFLKLQETASANIGTYTGLIEGMKNATTVQSLQNAAFTEGAVNAAQWGVSLIGARKESEGFKTGVIDAANALGIMLPESFRGSAESLQEWTEMTYHAGEAFDSFIEGIQSGAANIMGGLGDAIGKSNDDFNDAIDKLEDEWGFKIDGALKDVFEANAGADAIATMTGQLLMGVEMMGDQVTNPEAFRSLREGFTGRITETFDDIKEEVGPMAEGIINELIQVLNRPVDTSDPQAIKAWMGEVQSKLIELAGTGSATAQNMLTSMGSINGITFDPITKQFKDLNGNIISYADAAKIAAGNTDGLTSSFTAGAETIATWTAQMEAAAEAGRKYNEVIGGNMYDNTGNAADPSKGQFNWSGDKLGGGPRTDQMPSGEGEGGGDIQGKIDQMVTSINQIPQLMETAFTTGKEMSMPQLDELSLYFQATLDTWVSYADEKIAVAFTGAFETAKLNSMGQLDLLSLYIEATLGVWTEVLNTNVAVAFTQAFTTGTQNAAGMLTMLMGHAATVIGTINTIVASVAVAFTQAFNTGAQNAAGSLNALLSHATKIFNTIGAMPQQVAVQITSQFKSAADAAANALTALGNQALTVFEAIAKGAVIAATATDAIGKAANAARGEIAALASAMNNLPTEHTFTITTVYKTVGSPPNLAEGTAGMVGLTQREAIVGESGRELVMTHPLYAASGTIIGNEEKPFVTNGIKRVDFTGKSLTVIPLEGHNAQEFGRKNPGLKPLQRLYAAEGINSGYTIGDGTSVGNVSVTGNTIRSGDVEITGGKITIKGKVLVDNGSVMEFGDAVDQFTDTVNNNNGNNGSNGSNGNGSNGVGSTGSTGNTFIPGSSGASYVPGAGMPQPEGSTGGGGTGGGTGGSTGGGTNTGGNPMGHGSNTNGNFNFEFNNKFYKVRQGKVYTNMSQSEINQYESQYGNFPTGSWGGTNNPDIGGSTGGGGNGNQLPDTGSGNVGGGGSNNGGNGNVGGGTGNTGGGSGIDWTHVQTSGGSKWAKTDDERGNPNRWRVQPMDDDPSKWKIINRDNGKNIAANFNSEQEAFDWINDTQDLGGGTAVPEHPIGGGNTGTDTSTGNVGGGTTQNDYSNIQTSGGSKWATGSERGEPRDWQITAMDDDPNKFKIINKNNGKNIAAGFDSWDQAVRWVEDTEGGDWTTNPTDDGNQGGMYPEPNSNTNTGTNTATGNVGSRTQNPNTNVNQNNLEVLYFPDSDVYASGSAPADMTYGQTSSGRYVGDQTGVSRNSTPEDWFIKKQSNGKYKVVTGDGKDVAVDFNSVADAQNWINFVITDYAKKNPNKPPIGDPTLPLYRDKTTGKVYSQDYQGNLYERTGDYSDYTSDPNEHAKPIPQGSTGGGNMQPPPAGWQSKNYQRNNNDMVILEDGTSMSRTAWNAQSDSQRMAKWNSGGGIRSLPAGSTLYEDGSISAGTSTGGNTGGGQTGGQPTGGWDSTGGNNPLPSTGGGGGSTGGTNTNTGSGNVSGGSGIQQSQVISQNSIINQGNNSNVDMMSGTNSRLRIQNGQVIEATGIFANYGSGNVGGGTGGGGSSPITNPTYGNSPSRTNLFKLKPFDDIVGGLITRILSPDQMELPTRTRDTMGLQWDKLIDTTDPMNREFGFNPAFMSRELATSGNGGTNIPDPNNPPNGHNGGGWMGSIFEMMMRMMGMYRDTINMIFSKQLNTGGLWTDLSKVTAKNIGSFL